MHEGSKCRSVFSEHKLTQHYIGYLSIHTGLEAEEKERAARAKELSGRIEAISVTLAMKASEEGHLYGSVSVATLVEALAGQGVEVEPRSVKLADPIKEVGRYEVPIHLHDDVKTVLKVWVVEEKEVSDEVEVSAEGEDAAPATEDAPAPSEA